VRSRNCLPFTNTWVHRGFYVEFVLLLFLVFFVVFFVLLVVCVPNVSSVSRLYLRFSLTFINNFFSLKCELIVCFMKIIKPFQTTVLNAQHEQH
jgi:hypothetical protein